MSNRLKRVLAIGVFSLLTLNYIQAAGTGGKKPQRCPVPCGCSGHAGGCR